MIEYYCDACGKRITTPGIEGILEKCTNHLCVDCVVKKIKEYAKEVAECGKLRYAPYDALLYIYGNIAHILAEVNDIKSPYSPRCPVCKEDMKLINIGTDVVNRTYFCEKCMATYDYFGMKIKDVKE